MFEGPYKYEESILMTASNIVDNISRKSHNFSILTCLIYIGKHCINEHDLFLKTQISDLCAKKSHESSEF